MKLSLILLLACAAFSQTKPVMKPADYGKFETLGQGTLSPDGKWVAYEIRRTDRNDELRVAPLAGGKTQALAFCSAPAFSADSRWLACQATVSEAEQDKLKKAKKPIQNKMTVLELASGAVTTIDDVPAMAFSAEGAYLAFPRYPPAKPEGGRGGADTEKADPTGATLTVRNLTTGADLTFGNVTGMSWQDTGATLAMTIGVEGRTGNAVQIFDPKNGSLRVLDSGPALFTGLAWRKDSSDLAALRSFKQDGYDGESYMVLAWKALGEKRSAKVDAPQRLVASRTPQWSEDGGTLFVGIAEWLKKPEGRKGDDEASTVEVWHWKDENVISEQKLTAARDRDRNVLAAWHVAGGQLVPLSANNREDVRLAKRGNRALALDGTPYEDDSMFGRRNADVYKIDLTTGARTLVAKKLVLPVDFSPGGRYAMNFNAGHFQVYDLEVGATPRHLQRRHGASFTNKENDYPVPPEAGLRYRGLDAERPRRDRLRRLRFVGALSGWRNQAPPLDRWRSRRDPPSLCPRDRANRRWPRRTRRWRRLPNGSISTSPSTSAWKAAGPRRPATLAWRTARWSAWFTRQGIRGLEKAKNADVFLYQSGSWTTSPNYFATGADFKHPAGQRHQSLCLGICRGRAELIDYKNSQGDRLQGAPLLSRRISRRQEYP